MLKRSSEFISQSNSKGFPTASVAYRSLQSISNLTNDSLGSLESSESLGSSEIASGSKLYELPKLSGLSKLDERSELFLKGDKTNQ